MSIFALPLMERRLRTLLSLLLGYLIRPLKNARNSIRPGVVYTISYIAILVSRPHHVLRELLTFFIPSYGQAVRNARSSLLPETDPQELAKVPPRSQSNLSAVRVSEMPQKEICTQSQSSFLYLLPLEMRQQIYQHVLGDETLHLVRLVSRLGNVKCRDPSQPHPWAHRCWGISVKDSDMYWGPHDGIQEEHGGYLPLLQTCRQIYSEAIEILYSKNTFSMLHLGRLLHFSFTVLPQRMNAIRSLELGWYLNSIYPYDTGCTWNSQNPPAPYDKTTWERAWAILAGMDGLRNLRVDLVGRWMAPLPLEAELRMLSPATKVVNPRVWDLRLDWPNTGAQFEDAPFRITR